MTDSDASLVTNKLQKYCFSKEDLCFFMHSTFLVAWNCSTQGSTTLVTGFDSPHQPRQQQNNPIKYTNYEKKKIWIYIFAPHKDTSCVGVGEMSKRRYFRGRNVQKNFFVWVRNVKGKCPEDVMSREKNVWVLNVQGTKCPGRKCPMAKCPGKNVQGT